MASDFPQLLVLSGPEEGQEYTLPTQGKMRIGRADDNDLVLKDNSVSRHHVQITIDAKGILISDGGSSNGTILAGKTLKPNQQIPLKHRDEIQVGIYLLRFLANPFSEDNDNAKPASAKVSELDPHENENAEAEAILDAIPAATPQTAKPQFKPFADTLKELATRRIVWLIGAAVVLLILLFVLMQMRSNRKGKITPWDEKAFADSETTTKPVLHVPEKPVTQIPTTTVPTAITAPTVTTTPTDTNTTQPEPTVPQTVIALPLEQMPSTNVTQNDGQVTIFLDITTQPFPATLYLGEERLGRAPLRKSVTVKVGQPLDVYADYELTDVKDVYREKQVIVPKVTDDVLTLHFQAKLAEIQVTRLPRRAEFFWHGFYDYDIAKAFPVNLTRVSYGRPSYLPFGAYQLELREEAHVSGSSNLVSNITYQRDYVLNEQNNKIEISITDEDLKKFPVTIKSTPDGASVYRNEEKLGVTPFKGFLPVGVNPLKIRKDGFFEQVLNVDMPMNSIYETLVELKTSKMGEFILQAKERQHVEQNDEAIQLLIEALKYGGSDSEKAEVYFLLGATYFEKNELETAASYFGRSELSVDWQDRSKIALAQVLHRQGQTDKAIAKLADVMVRFDELSSQQIRQEANGAFKRISPVQSALYIYSEPTDANVFINDKLLEQTSPVLLSGLGLGNYRVRIEKNGYEIYNTKQTLKISEFVVVKVKLEKKEL